jgi:amino acid permease
MASARPTENDAAIDDLAAGDESPDIEKDPYHIDGVGQHHDHVVVADRLARKLSARQVQMIAIGMYPYFQG